MSVSGGPSTEGYSGMKLPSLIKQLQSVLEQYPDDGQILKELIQNAEDANAKEMKILYDGRIQDSPMSSDEETNIPHLKSLKGPGLCVFNDGLFQEKDWDGIRMIQSSVKEQEPDKVGRFGLGFKSVFHLTDVPVIISGKQVLFIDPHIYHEDPNRVCFIKMLDNVGDFEEALLRLLDGTFGFSKDTLNNGYFDGTLFWFPLRSAASELSEIIYDDDKMKDLLKAFKTEAPHMILFLKSLATIKVYQRNANLFDKADVDEGMVHLLTVDVTSGDDCIYKRVDMMALRRDFSTVVREHKGRLPITPVQRKYYVNVTIHDCMSGSKPITIKTNWLVLQYYCSENISKSFKKLCFDKTISSCPSVGVAVNLDEDQEGHIFCFLPLPLESKSPTGLPVHVHGHFALSQNRRHLKWPTADQKKNRAQTDKAIRWNQCLLLEALPEAYANLIEEMINYLKKEQKDLTFIQRIYSALPVTGHVTDHWKGLCKNFFNELFKRHFLYTQNDDRWVGVSDSVLLPVDCSKDIKDTLVYVYKECKENIVEIPPHVQEALMEYCPNSVLKFVTQEGLCATLRRNTSYHKLSTNQKLNLLEYICTNETLDCLNGLQLLPLADNSFATFGHTDTLIICKKDEVKMFPGLEGRFLLTNEKTDKHFNSMAEKGMFKLEKLTPTSFCLMLKNSLELIPTLKKLDPTSPFNQQWLQSIWKYITENEIDVVDEFLHEPIIPGEADIEGLTCLHPVSSSLICMDVETVGRIDKPLSEALKHLGVITLPTVPDALKKNSSVLGKIIQYPSVEGLLKVLDQVAQTPTLSDKVKAFNENALQDGKSSLVVFLQDMKSLSPPAKDVLRKLKLFSCTESEYDDLQTSIEEMNILEPKVDLPVSYPAVYLRFKNEQSSSLAKLLGAKQKMDSDVILDILRQMKEGNRRYSKEDIKIFMLYLLESKDGYLATPKIQKIASGVKFLKTENSSETFKAESLFIPQPEVRKLFLDQDIFPAAEFLKPSLKEGLKLLGLRTVNDIREKDLCEVGEHIEHLLEQGKTTLAVEKGQALLEYLKQNIKSLNIKSLKPLRYVRFVPCKFEKTGDYPFTLNLFSQEMNLQIARLENVWSLKYLYIAGSVSLVAKDNLENVLKAFDMPMEPPLDLVIKHLETVISSYKEAYSVEDKYSKVITEIYNFLPKIKLASETNANKKKLAEMKFVWMGPELGFHFAKNIWLKKSKYDIDLKPYRFCLPKLLHQMESVVLTVGGQKSQSPEMLVDVLREIKEKHDNEHSKNKDLTEDIQEDLRIICQILNKLKTVDKKPDGILLPVHQEESARNLLLKTVRECTYCNADWLKDQTVSSTDEHDDETIYFVHRDISEDTAVELGVTSLTDRVMDGTEAIDLNYGQVEPLTQRLHNILKGYSSSSVAKEMIQNAEDAKASKVIFLYDERRNTDARTSLMKEEMSSVQGPALWVYNDAEFSETDFKNIQELGGATKEEDVTKIGRYGLGFNSVYNLTDIPSFISGNTIVIFDPHQSFLGKPGIKADLTSVKNRRMLQTMKGQFKPFDGVFGCQIEQTRMGKICSGTLFRFPLRTQEQADVSKISDLYYTPSEMKTFLNSMAKSAGNLLLFTHHVKVVEIYHLKKENLPCDSKLLLTVKKNTESQHFTTNCETYPVQPIANPLTFLPSQVLDSEKADYSFMKETKTITLKTTAAFKDFGVQVQDDKTVWQITWAMGNETSKAFSNIKALKGLLPLAATAVHLKKENDLMKIGQLSECPKGFFTAGNLYSFLPLPLPSTLFDMHVSAQFAMSDDRQHLCENQEDSVRGDWNKYLEINVISRAIILTLVGLGDAGKRDLPAYYHLWPKVTQEEDHSMKDLISKPDIAKAFYKLIIAENHPVLITDSSKIVTFQGASFLDPQVAYDGKVGMTALHIFKSFWKGGSVVTLPKTVFKNIIAADQLKNLKAHVVKREAFYRKVFLPNLDQISSQDYQLLVNYALNTCDPVINDLLRSYRCISTKPNGSLKRPDELIHPNGKLSKLYDEADEKFPAESFSSKENLDKLMDLGMMDDEIPWDSLIERLDTVNVLYEKEPGKAQDRCLYILQYLNEFNPKEGVRRFSKCPVSFWEQIKETQFLPVLQKPSEWSYKWAADTGAKLAKAGDLFSDNAANIIGSLHLLLDSTSLHGLYAEKEVLKWLGVRDKTSVSFKEALDQLLQISRETSDLTPVTNDSTKIIYDIYGHLNSLCTNNRDCQILCSALINEKVIIHDRMLICPNQVAFHLGYDLKPFLFQIEHSQRNRFRHMFQAMGISETFSASRVKVEIDHLSGLFTQKCMSREEVRVYIQMVTLWLSLSNGDEVTQVMLPDSTNKLQMADTLCLDDCQWISEDSDMHFVHQSVPRDVALRLKVKTKIHANIQSLLIPRKSYTSSIKSFGQNEKQTRRLKGILEGYPKDSSIMKELLQNADDARATELKFIKDFRHHPTERILDDRYKPLQGPALLVWNNKGFTETDFEGIQALGEGSKSDDPLKTGQYGVGFNAVYHITDAPSFLTRSSDTENLCIFDPNLQYVPVVDQSSPGCQLEVSNNLKDNLRDMFHCYPKELFEETDEGTIFRLPLRTKEMAETSEISNEDTPIDGPAGIKQLLEDFKKEMKESLLFLHHVRKISVLNVTQEGTLMEEFTVNAVMSDMDEIKLSEHKLKIEKEAERRKQIHPKNKIQSDKQPEEDTVVTIKTCERGGKEQEWLVVHHFGFSGATAVPEIVNTSVLDGKIGKLPRGGVAVPVDHTLFSGRLFCILPLRVKTGLPIHINGHFALDHEARGNLWHGPHPYRTLWNESVITQVIVPAYVKALESLGTSLFDTKLTLVSHKQALSLYNNLFPLISRSTDEYWKLLCSSFYQYIVTMDSKLFPVVLPKDGKFSDSQKTDTIIDVKMVSPTKKSGQGIFNTIQCSTLDIQLTEVLKDLGMKIIDTSSSVYSQFQEAKLEDQISFTSPRCVMKFLKTFASTYENRCQLAIPADIESTTMKTLSSLIAVTNYCQSGDSKEFSDELNGLPLLLTQDNVLRCFDSNKPTIVSPLTDLLKGSLEKAVHHRLVSKYQFMLTEGKIPECIKRLDIETFSTLLPNMFGHLSSTVPVEWIDSDRPPQQWIAKVWDFLGKEIERVTKGRQPDAATIRSHLLSLEKWCLLPVVVKHGSESRYYLYPIDEVKNVFQSNFSFSLRNLAVPQLYPETFHGSNVPVIAKEIVVSFQNPFQVLQAIVNATKKGLIINQQSGHQIMTYFCSNLEGLQGKVSVPLLKNLRIFEDLSGTATDVGTDTVYGIIGYDNIPQHGIGTWSAGSGIKLLRCLKTTRCLFDFLRIPVLPPEKLYESFILEKFAALPKDSRAIHLKYLKDHLLNSVNVFQRDLIKCLKDLHFIEGPDGSLHKACEYFSKDEKLFQLFVEQDKFPPSPYDQDEWKVFMVKAGIIKEVSQEQFLAFARQVERTDERPFTNQMEKKSKQLVHHLLHERSDLLKGTFLSTLKNIRFVLPHQMENYPDQKVMIKEIHPQLQQGRLIAYSGSVSSEHCYYVWSSCSMFVSSADPDYFKFKHSQRERAQISKNLGIMKEPTVQTIVKHVLNLSETMVSKQKDGPVRNESLKDILKKVMESIYKQLLEKKNSLNPSTLSSAAVIFLPEEGIFVRADQIVLEMTEKMFIKDHMYRAPIHFGKFFDLFLFLGATRNVTANHYAVILQILKQKTCDTQLEPNELARVKEATKWLFEILKDEIKEDRKCSLEVPILYLLDREHVLVDSTQLTVNDNMVIEKRVKSLNLRFFVGFQKLEIPVVNEEEVFSNLPLKYQPKILTKNVEEVISEDCKQKAFIGPLSQEYKSLTSQKQFLVGVVRLISDQRRLARLERLEADKLHEIEAKIVSLNVQEVEGLKTVLTYNSKQVEKSEENQICFLDTQSDPLKVYLNASTRMFGFHKKVLHKWLAEALNKLTGLHLTTFLTHLEGMFECTLDQINDFLDRMKVSACSYVSTHEEETVFPRPGTYVPKTFHWMLDNSFSKFEENEYVALEIYDPLNDDTEQGHSLSSDKKDPLYIYARIIKIISQDDSVINGKYLIDAGESEPKEVGALDLYKFSRIERERGQELVPYTGPETTNDRSNQTPEETAQNDPPLDMETVLTEIRETLTEAWKVTDKKARDKIKKRLLLKWHPDKNRKNVDFCTKVFQKLQNYISILEVGGKLNKHTDSQDTGPKPHKTGFEEWFYEEMKRRSQQHHHDYEHQRRRHFNFDDSFSSSRSRYRDTFGSHRSARDDPHPQPEEARRWMRQARRDLQVARHTLSLDSAFNWVCFQCYMACEKAVKSLLYNRDAKQGDTYRKEDLSSLVNRVSQDNIGKLIRRLLLIVGTAQKMQNPAKLNFPNIPSDSYTQGNAIEACEITEEVLQKTEDIIG